MGSFPVSPSEWAHVKKISVAILNADKDEDFEVRDLLKADIILLLNRLRLRYGDHPVLLESIADYTDDDEERIRIYEQAISIAKGNGLNTLSVNLSLARTCVESGNAVKVMENIRLCGEEAVNGEVADRENWLTHHFEVASYGYNSIENQFLIKQAIQIAKAYIRRTLDIQFCYIRLLIDVGNITTAREELNECKFEAMSGTKKDKDLWDSYLRELGSLESKSII